MAKENVYENPNYPSASGTVAGKILILSFIASNHHNQSMLVWFNSVTIHFVSFYCFAYTIYQPHSFSKGGR